MPFVKSSNALATVQATCEFWDEKRKVYSSDGCIGHPNPRPAGHNISWRAGFTTASDAGLIMVRGSQSWAGAMISPPL